MSGPDGPNLGHPEPMLLNLVVGAVTHPPSLFAVVVLGCAIALLGHRSSSAVIIGYCLAALGLLALLAGPLIAPYAIGRLGWTITALITYAGSALGPQLLSRRRRQSTPKKHVKESP